MGKKKDKPSVGRSVIKDRSKGAKHGKGKESWLHTSELDDGEDWSKMQSVTEQSTLDEFLATAELAGTEFVAEKLNVSVVSASNRGGLPSLKEEQRIQQIQDENKKFLQIPRRPHWDETTTAEKLEQLEKESFLAWRRNLAKLQEKDDIILTPFERNLEFWRQLWRVIERSDVVVQIVDARNPLLFRCEDLESYVNEVSSSKANVLLVNKADLLTQEQREIWARYFKSVNVKAIFWSAVFETERLKQLKILEESNSQETTEPETNSAGLIENVLADEHVTKFLDLHEEMDLQDSDSDEKTSLNVMGSEEKEDQDLNVVQEKLGELCTTESYPGECNPRECYPGDVNTTEHKPVSHSDIKPSVVVTENTSKHNMRTIEEGSLKNQQNSSSIAKDTNDDKFGDECAHVDLSNEGTEIIVENITHIAGKAVDFYTSGHLLTGEELLAYCQWLHHVNSCGTKEIEDGSATTVIGLVGYPNVGKSSTINAILHSKKVPVSATPGRTKHFQTLFVDKSTCLCDCPGLVFPSFVSTKAEMVVNGILPIDQMRDHVAPVSLVCRRIPRSVLETVYGINLVAPGEGEDPDREPYADELLNAYGYSKGYMTSQGRPDCPRSSRYILKDYVNGKLLFCHPPPLHDLNSFQISFTGDTKPVRKRLPTSQKSGTRTDVLDEAFFKQEDPKSYVSATTGTQEYQRQMATGSSAVPVGKPWKKHGNRNKKEKLRRLHPKDY